VQHVLHRMHGALLKILKSEVMKNNSKTVSLDQIKDKYIGKVGTTNREIYEIELKLDLIGEMIKSARKKRKLTQEELGNLIGVQKSQISKLENGASNVTIGTILKVFEALKAKVNFKVELLNQRINAV